MLNTPQLIFLLFLGSFGACIGSFLNVCIHRIPLKLSIVSPPSACPFCSYQIKFYDNIPLLSWIILSGKCRKCKAPISARYICIEAFTAVMFVLYGLSFLQYPDLPKSIFSANFTGLIVHLILLSILISCSLIDLEKGIIPNSITYPWILIALILSFAFPQIHFAANSRLHALFLSFLGLVIGYGSLWIIAFIGKLISGKEVMGGGDLKLQALIGAFIGPVGIIVVFFIAPIIGSVWGIIHKIKTGNAYLPYGPSIAIASIVTSLYFQPIFKFLIPFY